MPTRIAFATRQDSAGVSGFSGFPFDPSPESGVSEATWKARYHSWKRCTIDEAIAIYWRPACLKLDSFSMSATSTGSGAFVGTTTATLTSAGDGTNDHSRTESNAENNFEALTNITASALTIVPGTLTSSTTGMTGYPASLTLHFRSIPDSTDIFVGIDCGAFAASSYHHGDPYELTHPAGAESNVWGAWTDMTTLSISAMKQEDSLPAATAGSGYSTHEVDYDGMGDMMTIYTYSAFDNAYSIVGSVPVEIAGVTFPAIRLQQTISQISQVDYSAGGPYTMDLPGIGGASVSLTAEIGTCSWLPYSNSVASPVFDETTGAQLCDPRS